MSGPGPGALLDRGSPTGAAVAARRDALNAVLRRAAAQGASDGLLLTAAAEATGHARALEGRVAGDTAAAERLGDVVEALVGAAARACVRGRWGEGSPERWALSVVPALGPWALAAPHLSATALVAAARAVRRDADADAWVRRLAAASSVTCDVPAADLVRPALLVAAWRSGLSRYRDAALEAAAALPAAVAAAALGLDPAAAGDLGRDVLARHRADPWWWPGRPAVPGVAARYGGFRGLGGPWLTRPTVVGRARADDGGPGWLVDADGQRWVVVDDAHGVAVVRAGAVDDAPVPRQDAPPPDPGLLAAVVPWEDEVTGAAACPTPSGTVVLVSRAHSYGLDLVRLPAAGDVAGVAA